MHASFVSVKLSQELEAQEVSQYYAPSLCKCDVRCRDCMLGLVGSRHLRRYSVKSGPFRLCGMSDLHVEWKKRKAIKKSCQRKRSRVTAILGATHVYLDR